MPFKPLVIAGIEGVLNTFLYCSPALKTARQRLNGKILRITFKKFSIPLVLFFSEHQLDVLGEWKDEADCSVITTSFSVLLKLCNHQQLITLIHNGDLEVKGDLQVVHNFVMLVDMAELDLAELLAPYVGDIVAEVISTAFCSSLAFLRKGMQRHQRYVADIVTEEWRVAPGPLEVAWFVEETAVVYRAVEAFTQRLENWRANDA